MKADHRHDLKTNELAEWLSNLPQWVKENRTTVLIMLVVVIGVAAFYLWQGHSKNRILRKKLQLTTLANQILQSKMRILEAQAQGRDLSYILLQPAESLRTFAQNTDDDQMAALALIKRAEALRMELHYRLGNVSQQDFTDQINQAKDSYSKALERCSTNPSLMAMAKFGLGLCEEELGNPETAKQIYQSIAESNDFDGTVAKAAARHRLKTMSDYQQRIVFRRPPLPKPIVRRKPPTEVKPADTNTPVDTNQTTDVKLPIQAPGAFPQASNANGQAEPPKVSDINATAPKSHEAAKPTDSNVPIK